SRVDETDRGGHYPNERDGTQRHGREGHQGIDGDLDLLPERPFRHAGVALVTIVFDLSLSETGRENETEGQAVALGEGIQPVDDLAIEQAEGAGSGRRKVRQRDLAD